MRAIPHPDKIFKLANAQTPSTISKKAQNKSPSKEELSKKKVQSEQDVSTPVF